MHKTGAGLRDKSGIPLRIMVIFGLLAILVPVSCSNGGDWQALPLFDSIESDCGEEYLNRFPGTLDRFNLCSVLEGEEALPLFTTFLGKDYDLTGSYIAVYSCGKDKLVLWMAGVEGKEEIQSLLKEVDNRVFDSPSFYDVKRLVDVDLGEIVYAASINENEAFKHNYYYKRNNFFYWVSLDGEPDLSPVRIFMNYPDLP